MHASTYLAMYSHSSYSVSEMNLKMAFAKAEKHLQILELENLRLLGAPYGRENTVYVCF